MNRNLAPLILALASAPLAVAQLEPLDRPLTLPPGLIQTLPVNKAKSYFGDSIRIADCPLDKDNPFGTCGNVLFGGHALFASPISGMVQVKFYPPFGNISHFEISHPSNLTGDDVPLKAPQAYSFFTQQNRIFDAFEKVSSGDLNLATGEVTNFEFAANFFNTFYQAFGRANPRLKLSSFRFPGAYGSAYLRFEQRPDGLLDLTFHGTTFLPLGKNIDGQLPRIPMPFCAQNQDCMSIQAAGSSFRPSIQYTTKASTEADDAPCGAKCIDVPYNSIQMYSVHTFNSYFREGFQMNIPQLGGVAIGRTHWTGRVQVQFGERTGDTVPVFFELLSPPGTIGEPPEIDTTLPLPDGVTVGFIGHDIILRFPFQTFFPIQMNYATDPFDGIRGLYNVKTGKFVDELLFSGFLSHNVLLRVIEQNNGRIPLSPFLTRGPASFEKSADGQSLFRFSGRGYRNYEGFLFPAPSLQAAHAWVAGPGSRLDPNIRVEAAQTVAVPGPVVKTGSFNVTTPTGDPVQFTYSVPCNALGRNGTFEFTNNGAPRRNGTFKMVNLVSVHCTNSRTSTAPPGDYDIISFTGFGTWSKDPLEKDPHVAAVHVYLNSPQGPYFSVLIDGGELSNADLKPPLEPTPDFVR